MNLALMNAGDAATAIRDGRITSEELVQACLDHVDQLEDRVEAWTFLDSELALDQARKADLAHQAGIALGPLHGVPVGIKDIIDTYDMPTEDGTVLHAGRQPLEDATIIRRLREAGAVILGKTVTTELAVFAPSKTKNPHDLKRTPGGSSSGSAAAVAAGMIPLAVGTQTNGSVIRPASFCGVYGYKPTFGLISRHLVLQQSRRLDQIGVFARSVEDAALIAEALIGFDINDPDTSVQARLALVRIQGEDPPMAPKLAFVKTPVWDQADESTRGAFTELASHLGERAEEVELPSPFNRAHELHKTIMEADIARSFEREYTEGSDQLSLILKEIIGRGNQTLAVDYNNAVLTADELYRNFDKIFEWHDAIITPATIGEAPVGLETTGDPTFCTIWTLCGMPSITLPVLQGENNMPLGLQLVGARGDDARLLRTARWLVKKITETDY
jgi:Asp-tRNA(Asn)/Glu-tRNA(Gln) amidotransferase A subunit family amidase